MRSDEWIFGPREAYERQGDVAGVVFPCGYTIGDDGDTLNVYYGAADTCIGLATGRISEILNWLDNHAERGSGIYAITLATVPERFCPGNRGSRPGSS